MVASDNFFEAAVSPDLTLLICAKDWLKSAMTSATFSNPTQIARIKTNSQICWEAASIVRALLKLFQ